MFFNDTGGVLLLSLALYGLWCGLTQVWSHWVEPKVTFVPRPTVVIVFQNIEYEAEAFLRLLFELTAQTSDLQLVLVDEKSHDLTYEIAQRLCLNRAGTVLMQTDRQQLGLSILPVCEGELIIWLDTVRRLTLTQCLQFVAQRKNFLNHFSQLEH